LLTDGAYNFTSEAGEFASRFEVLYQLPLGTVNPSLESAVTIVRNNGVFAINSGNVIMDNVKVFDIRGRLLKTLSDVNDSQAQFNISGANQVLIVVITSDNGQQVTKKVLN